LRGLDEVDNGYLYYVLKREVAQFKDNAYGSTFGSITTKTFDSIKIAVPPIDVQLSIVTEIEQIETKITAAQQIIDSAASKKQDILKQYL
jgi:restriction endonuclease S subunit